MLQRPGGKKRQQQVEAQQALEGLEAGGEEEQLLFSECNPLVLAQLSEQPHREFPTFDAALDEFFSKVGGAPARRAAASRTQGQVPCQTSSRAPPPPPQSP
jgi:hypothetical protein